MKKVAAIVIGLVLIAGGTFAFAQVPQKESYSWRYKMTVTVETPEGEVSGSAVRQMGDNYKVSFPAEASNYGEVAGEAVVVDLGDRGVLFALISHDSDGRFYSTFPVPEGAPETPQGYAYYASLPVGTKAEMPLSSRMPKLVTFTDMDEPKSVTLVYARGNCRQEKPLPKACEADPRGSYTKVDRFEELFGDGVKFKGITLEITEEPTTWGMVGQYLSWLNNYYDQLFDGRKIHTSRAENQLANSMGAGSFSTRRFNK